jgi:transmembrane sensor
LRFAQAWFRQQAGGSTAAGRYCIHATRSILKATVIVLLVPGAVSGWPDSDRIIQHLGFKTEHVFSTRLGEQRDIEMTDGPRVTLDTRSSIHTQASRELQRIDLDNGVALIDSMQGPARPIRVPAGDIAIEASRARFSIRRDTQETYSVRVFGGAVTLTPNDSETTHVTPFRPVRLVSGQAALIGPGAVLLTRFSADGEKRFLAWTRGQLSFDGESIADAVAEFNRYNRRQIAIGDDSIAHIRIGGAYKSTNPEGFAHALERTFALKAVYVRSGGMGGSTIVLKAASAQRAAR